MRAYLSLNPDGTRFLACEDGNVGRRPKRQPPDVVVNVPFPAFEDFD